jgi:2-polyprenyl-3-methyl-5-hydroxy-6-metoxy-1,4-benzoquinol methylase
VTTDGIVPILSEKMIGPSTVETIELGLDFIRLMKPADMDKLLDSQEIGDRFQESAYMPYWASVWPVSRALALKIIGDGNQSRKLSPNSSVLELGCGLGLAGIAALKAGHSVTFSDYDASALNYARKNAELNGFHSAKFLGLNWKSPLPMSFDVIIGADLTWDLDLVPHMINVFSEMLKPDGVIWLADQNRLNQSDFFRRLEFVGLRSTTEPLALDPDWGWDISGTFYEITRKPRP